VRSKKVARASRPWNHAQDARATIELPLLELEKLSIGLNAGLVNDKLIKLLTRSVVMKLARRFNAG
jgi:hypothetical protein